MNDVTVLLTHSNPLGRSYLAKLPDGGFLAGRTEATAKKFPSAQSVYDYYYDDACQGDHSAWNICYFVQDELPRPR
jgi:hypothetical protein